MAVANDVNAILWGEYLCGAARGARDALCVAVGTGIGGAIIANGRLLEGHTHTAGEIGHIKVGWDADAARCACGRLGCLEAYVGGKYLLARIRRELANRPDALPCVLAGGVDQVQASHVDEAAGRGDAWALALWQELATLLALAIGNGLILLNPAVLVLAGGVLPRTPNLLAFVETALPLAASLEATDGLRVELGQLGDDAGLIGAAALATAASTAGA